jgi:murein DD-endopeptidase MepM/ murein hydrolase activator NlpD
VRRFAFGVVLAVLATCTPAGAAFAAAAQLGEGQAVGTSEVGDGQALECTEEAATEADAEAPAGEEVEEGEAAGCASEEPEEETEVEPAPTREKEEAEDPKPKHHRAPAKKVKRGSEIVASEAEASTDKEEEPEEEAEGGETSSAESAEGALSSLSLGDGASSLGELEVPTALLPVYEACGTRYGISWEVLAAINKVETGFGTDLGTSGAGAEGWMQFLPSSWKDWGVDADGDGTADTDDPVDAICSAARYLAASGGEADIYDAVLAYNHADWYAREVLTLARSYERVPGNLVNSLSALAEGSTSPVSGEASTWNRGAAVETLSSGWASEAIIPSGEAGTTATINGERGAKVSAVVDGTIATVGDDSVVLTDPYGDRFVYSGLGSTAVAKGDPVAAGDPLGKVGGTAIGFSTQPDASTAIDPTELLEIWKEGGVGAIYGVDSSTATKESAATRSLLMSTDALRREVLADEDLELPSCVREAVSAGELQRQSLATLEYLTGSGYEVGLAASTCSHSAGFALEIGSVDGKSVDSGQGAGTSAYELVRAAVAMDAAAAPQTVSSATGLAGGETGGTAATAIELDYRPPSKARIVDGDAVAPTDAPAAVQAMIAAANQIDETPYVWGGGHGAWVSAGYDCSGSVSYVLHAAKLLATPETSGALTGWGESGSGNWVTVYANAEHTYAVIAGLRWDTVGDVSGSGPRWHTEAAYPAGFTVRHPAGY